MNLRPSHLLGGILMAAGLYQLSVGGWSTDVSAAGAYRSVSTSSTAVHAARGAYDVAVAYYRAGKYAQAEKQFRVSISRRQHVPESYDGVGKSALALHEYRNAYGAYKKLASMLPKNPAMQYWAAYTALYAAYYHDAVKFATLAIKLSPKSWESYRLRFLAYGRLLLPKQQVEDATIIVKLRPQDASAWNDFGIALSQVKQYKSAIRAESYAIKLQPRNPLFYINRAVTENQNKQPKLALRDFKKARALTADPRLAKQLDAEIQYLQKRIHR